MKIEVWKSLFGYEGIYEVSNFGNVKSLSRIIKNNGGHYLSKESLLKIYTDNLGYLRVGLCKNSISKKFRIHILVAISFLNHTPKKYKLIVDHIDNNKKNNNLDNLQIITQRLNSSKDRVGSSKYTGVCFIKANNKWRAAMQINGKNKHIGLFTEEIDAHLAYQKYLKENILC
jgi:hypothetical protein